MSVYKPEKSPYWHYDFQYQGDRFYGSTNVKTKRAAEAVERKRRQEAALGELGADVLTLGQGATRWWNEVGQHRGDAADVWRRIGVVLRLLGKNRKFPAITNARISEAMQKRRGEFYTKSKKPGAKRYPIEPATVNRDIIETLRPIMRAARTTWEVKGVRDIDWKKLRLKEPPGLVQSYTAEQRATWMAACGDDAEARLALRILLNYGLRFGELFFSPRAYDPDGPRISLDADDRKRGVALDVPLLEEDAREIAARVGRARAAGMPSIWFTKAKKAQKPTKHQVIRKRLASITYASMEYRLMKAARAAGIDGRRLIHGARHHAATDTLRVTGDLALTKQLLGHANISSTARYAHVMDKRLRAALVSRNSPEPRQPDSRKKA